MRGRFFGLVVAAIAISGCDGGKDPLAELCVSEAAGRLQGQVYRLDEAKLTARRSSRPAAT